MQITVVMASFRWRGWPSVARGGAGLWLAALLTACAPPPPRPVSAPVTRVQLSALQHEEQQRLDRYRAALAADEVGHVDVLSLATKDWRSAALTKLHDAAREQARRRQSLRQYAQRCHAVIAAVSPAQAAPWRREETRLQQELRNWQHSDALQSQRTLLFTRLITLAEKKHVLVSLQWHLVWPDARSRKEAVDLASALVSNADQYVALVKTAPAAGPALSGPLSVHI